MKTKISIFSALIAFTLMFVACTSEESEIIKQARGIQEGIMTSKANLDSVIDMTIADYNTKITNLSQDSVAMADSTIQVTFSEIQQKVITLGEYKSKLADWMSNTKMLPSVEEMAKGAENPFGADAKDEDILNQMKAAQEEFNSLKSAIETEMM